MVLHKEKQIFYAGRTLMIGQSGRLTLQIWGYNKCMWYLGQETPRKIVTSIKEKWRGGEGIKYDRLCRVREVRGGAVG